METPGNQVNEETDDDDFSDLKPEKEGKQDEQGNIPGGIPQGIPDILEEFSGDSKGKTSEEQEENPKEIQDKLSPNNVSQFSEKVRLKLRKGLGKRNKAKI